MAFKYLVYSFLAHCGVDSLSEEVFQFLNGFLAVLCAITLVNGFSTSSFGYTVLPTFGRLSSTEILRCLPELI